MRRCYELFNKGDTLKKKDQEKDLKNMELEL